MQYRYVQERKAQERSKIVPTKLSQIISKPIELLTSKVAFYFLSNTACVRSLTGRYCFHRCLSVHTRRGTPSPSHNTSTGPMSFLWGTPVIGPRSLPRGYPSDWSRVPSWGVPSPRWGYPRTGYPQPGMGYPPPG